MRTFSGKYYANLFQVLEHLNIPTQIHRFRYIFTEGPRQYFQFFSNFHQILPCLQNSWYMNAYLLFCYLWYTIAVFLFPPLIRSPDSLQTKTETLDEYAKRIHLSNEFLDWYLLPLFSSVATCSHDHLRDFPAAYIVNYRKGTLAAHHRTVIDMHGLQNRLAEGTTIALECEVTAVTNEGGKVVLEHRGPIAAPKYSTSVYDHVIIATSAAEASKIHKASLEATSQLSTCPVLVTVHQPTKEQEALRQATKPSEILALSTSIDPAVGVITHSTHLHWSGMAVKVAAYSSKEIPDESGKSLHVVKLLRPLPNPTSHNVLLEVFNRKVPSKLWRNGDGNVYLAGGYASAGLPLLEACVRSGLEAAEAIGAKLPFELVRKTPF